MTSILNANYVSNTATTASGSQITKQNEQLYGQSNLIGTWSGKWTGTNQPVTFKVISITGSTAQIEYDHNGQVQKGQAQVSKNTLTFGNVIIGTKDGSKGAIEFAVGSFKQTGSLTKTAATGSDPNQLVGSWSGLTSTGNAASFTVKSITGTSADVSATVNGITTKGTATYNAANHVISLGNTQITSTDGSTGNVIFKSLGMTYSVPVTKASTTKSTVSTFA